MDSSLFIKMPGGVGKAIPNHIWDYASDPSPALGLHGARAARARSGRLVLGERDALCAGSSQ
jgi:hypothetical protein